MEIGIKGMIHNTVQATKMVEIAIVELANLNFLVFNVD